MKCPKRYGAYDVANHNCPECKQGFLYQVCRGDDFTPHLACAGWLDPKTYEPLCCKHYKERHPDESKS